MSKTSASATSSSSRHRRSSRHREQAPGPAATSPMIDQLNQLATLHQQGVLTDDEFTAAKAKLFGT